MDFAKHLEIGPSPQWSDCRNIDINLKLRKAIKDSNVVFDFRHIKSHQDPHQKTREYTLQQRQITNVFY